MKTRILIAGTAIGLSMAMALPAAAFSLSDLFDRGNDSVEVNGSAQVESSASVSGNGTSGQTSTNGSANVSGQASVGGSSNSSGNTGLGADIKGTLNTLFGRDNATSSNEEPQACTMEAKQCPDGSYVGRTGPNCSFAACPGETTSGTGNENSGSEGNAGIDLGLGSVIVTRADVTGNAVAATNSDWSQVRSDADLSGYIAAHIANDENIERVQVSTTNVAVTYKQQARLLGFIPTTIKATAMVEGDGDVSVSYPWYGFLYATTDNSADVEAKVKARVDAMLRASGNASGDASLNSGGDVRATGNAQASVATEANATAELATEMRARLVAEIRAALEEAYNADVSANASAQANGSVEAQ